MAQPQGFHSTDPMQSYARQDLFGLQTSMEMLGFSPKDSSFHHQQQQGRDPPPNPSMPSSSSWRGGGGDGGFFPKASPADPSSNYYDTGTGTAFSETNEWVHPFQPLMPATGTNQLSLSLFDTNPRASDVAMQGQQQHVEGREGWFFHQQQQPHPELRRSKYLVPAQELLNEFCSIESSHVDWKKKKSKAQCQWEEAGGASSSPSWNHSLQSMDILELQRRKARLLFMLEEVDRRYRRYCEQMRSVVAGFEAVAGEGAAAVYAVMARKAMSRHFRCLRDGVVVQVRATKKVMGEKEGVGGAAGATRGETPRLRVLDQCLRQQKLLQQGGMMESHPWRPQRGLPERSVSILRSWLFEHFLHPYPSDVDKHILARQTGLSRSQVSNWFINARVRLWKPMVEEMYLEETKDQENQSSATSTTQHDLLISPTNRNPNLPHVVPLEDQKPDSDSLSSIIIGATSLDVRNLPRSIHNHHHQQLVDVDFSSYNGSGQQQSFGNNVSLTLGLQQHEDEGRGLSYPPAAVAVAPPSQSSMFFGREPVQFTVLEGDGQNMSHPYRNLMEAQLLHDLAG